MDGLDRYITSGRYSKELIRVHCAACGEWTSVVAETEYGATDWTPDECSACQREFPSGAKWEDDEPPEQEPDDDPGPATTTNRGPY